MSLARDEVLAKADSYMGVASVLRPTSNLEQLVELLLFLT